MLHKNNIKQKIALILLTVLGVSISASAQAGYFDRFNIFNNIDYSSLFTGEHRVRNITLATAGLALAAGGLYWKGGQLWNWLTQKPTTNTKQLKPIPSQQKKALPDNVPGHIKTINNMLPEGSDMEYDAGYYYIQSQYFNQNKTEQYDFVTNLGELNPAMYSRQDYAEEEIEQEILNTKRRLAPLYKILIFSQLTNNGLAYDTQAISDDTTAIISTIKNSNELAQSITCLKVIENPEIKDYITEEPTRTYIPSIVIYPTKGKDNAQRVLDACRTIKNNQRTTLEVSFTQGDFPQKFDVLKNKNGKMERQPKPSVRKFYADDLMDYFEPKFIGNKSQDWTYALES